MYRCTVFSFNSDVCLEEAVYMFFLLVLQFIVSRLNILFLFFLLFYTDGTLWAMSL